MKKNTALQIIVLALAFILIAGVIVGVIFWQNGNISFTPVGQEQTGKPDEGVPVIENGGAVIDTSVENGIKVMSAKIPFAEFAANGVSAQADSAYTLTATIKPETAENKTVNWSIAWSNANSEWASGKTVTDYVTISAEVTESGEDITVTCLKDFGETVTITAVSDFDESIKGTCFVDYRKRIVSLNYSFQYDDSPVEGISADADGVYRFDYTGDVKNYTVTPVPVYSAYTIDVEYKNTINGSFSDSFGYENGVTFDSIYLSAGLTGVIVEPELSSDGQLFVNTVESVLSAYNNAFVGMMMRLDELYPKLSEQDKAHSRIKNAYQVYQIMQSALISSGNGSIPIEVRTEAGEVFNSYTPPVSNGSFMGGVTIPSIDALLQAAKMCNDSQKGIVEYTITFTSDDLSYSSKISLGYTASSLNVVRGIEMSLPSLVL